MHACAEKKIFNNAFREKTKIRPKPYKNIYIYINKSIFFFYFYRKSNRTEECIRMLQKCIAIDPTYAPAYLVLARMTSGPATGALLRHVVRLQPKNPDHLAEYALWLSQNGNNLFFSSSSAIL